MDQGWRIVPTVDPQQRIAHHRFAQIGISISRGILQRGLDPAALEMHLLAHLHEQNRHARILAGGNLLFLGVGSVRQQKLNDLLAGGRPLPHPRRAHCRHIILRQPVRGPAQQIPDRLPHLADINCSQSLCLLFPLAGEPPSLR